jgi:hypothetical protein
LRWNDLKSAGGQAILDALEASNSTLTEIHVAGNSIPADIVLRIGI